MEEPKYHLSGVLHAKSELEDFDGPLDVILLLLSKNKIEIQDISITSILEQYLAYLDGMKRMDMEIASEFITMASRLMYIKTKMLLSVADREEAESEMDLLIRSLEARQREEAYKQIRLACDFLEGRAEIGRGFFCKPPEPVRRDGEYHYQHEPEDLLRAMANVAERSGQRLPPPARNFVGIVGAEPYPVAAKAAEVIRRLAAKGRALLINLFRGNRSRSEIVATFLAVLELCKMKSIRLDESGGETVACLTEPPAGEA